MVKLLRHACHLGARRRLQHLAFVHVSTIRASSLVPRPLPDFISQRDKIWGWPGDGATIVSQATLFLSLCEKGVACETKLPCLALQSLTTPRLTCARLILRTYFEHVKNNKPLTDVTIRILYNIYTSPNPTPTLP